MIRNALDEDQIFDGAISDYNIAYRSVLKNGRFLHANHTFSINGYSPASTGGGHNAAQSNTGGDGASKLFSAENKIDPMQDVIGHAGSVALGFFLRSKQSVRDMIFRILNPIILLGIAMSWGSRAKTRS